MILYIEIIWLILQIQPICHRVPISQSIKSLFFIKYAQVEYDVGKYATSVQYTKHPVFKYSHPIQNLYSCQRTPHAGWEKSLYGAPFETPTSHRVHKSYTFTTPANHGKFEIHCAMINQSYQLFLWSYNFRWKYQQQVKWKASRYWWPLHTCITAVCGSYRSKFGLHKFIWKWQSSQQKRYPHAVARLRNNANRHAATHQLTLLINMNSCLGRSY